MEQKYKYEESLYLELDIPYLMRKISSNLLVIIMCAVITGIGVYIGLSSYLKNTYTASIQLAVVSRDNVGYKMSDYNLGTALSKNLSILNGNDLLRRIEKENGQKNSGTLYASQIGNTNLIILKATSESAEEAFRLLKSGIDIYPQLLNYSDSGYLVRCISKLSADTIVKTTSKTKKYTALAVLCVLAAGFGITGLTSIFTNKIHSREQASKLLNMDVLGVLHKIRKKKKGITITDSKVSISYIEDIDRLSTRVEGLLKQKDKKTIMATSPNENEGKTTLIINIALNLARRGKKVVIIDCDLRNPSLYRILEHQIASDQNLSNYLLGKKDLKDVVIPMCEYGELYCIMQRTSMPDADILLGKDSFENMIKTLEKEFDYIVLDTPPFGLMRDAELVASVADNVLIAIRQDKTQVSQVNEMIDILEENGVTVLGGVINMYQGSGESNNNKYKYEKYSNI